MADEESITDIMGTAEARQKLKELWPGRFRAFHEEFNFYRDGREVVEYFVYVNLNAEPEPSNSFCFKGDTPAAAIEGLQEKVAKS